MADNALQKFEKDQKLPFLFEVVDGNGKMVYEYVLPINPENYECTFNPRVNYTYTQGGGFEDKAGVTRPKISLSGTFTYAGNVEIKAKQFDPSNPASFSSVSSIATGLFGTANVTKGPGKTLQSASNLTGWDMYQEFAGMIFQFYEMFGTVDLEGQEVATKTSAGKQSGWNLAAQKFYAMGLNTAAAGDSKPTLRFYNFAEDDYFTVQINRFVIKRGLQRRMLYQYDLQMTVLGRINDLSNAQTALDAWTAKYKLAPAPFSLFQSALKAYGSISNSVSTLANLIDSASSTITTIRAAVSGFLGNINNVAQSSKDLKKNASAAMAQLGNLGAALPALYTAKGNATIPVEYRQVEQVRATVSQALEVATSIDGLPHEFVDMLRTTMREIFIYQANKRLFPQVNNLGTAYTATSGGTADPTRLEVLTGTAPNSSQAATSMVLDVPENTIFGQSTLSSVTTTVKEVTIRSNDSINTIARDAGCRWEDLVTLNDLDYPYVSTVGIPGSKVLLPGQTIKVPSTEPSVHFAGSDSANQEALLYGTDEYLDEDGMQQFGADGDMMTVSGIPNLLMQLEHRQNTPRGALSLLGHPGYGSLVPTYLGRPGLEMWYRRLLLEQESVLLQDPRVASVANVTLRATDDKSYSVSDVILIDRTTLPATQLQILGQNA